MTAETPDNDPDSPEALLIEALLRGDDDVRTALLLRWVCIRADANRQDDPPSAKMFEYRSI